MVAALRAVEQLVLDRDSFKWREQLGLEMSYVVYDGRWFAPLRRSLQASAEALAEEVNGEVVLQLYKGRDGDPEEIGQQPVLRRVRHFRRRRSLRSQPRGRLYSPVLSVFTHPCVERERINNRLA